MPEYTSRSEGVTRTTSTSRRGARASARSTNACAWPPPTSNSRFIAPASLRYQRHVAEPRRGRALRVVGVGRNRERRDLRQPGGRLRRKCPLEVRAQVAPLVEPPSLLAVRARPQHEHADAV